MSGLGAVLGGCCRESQALGDSREKACGSDTGRLESGFPWKEESAVSPWKWTSQGVHLWGDWNSGGGSLNTTLRLSRVGVPLDLITAASYQ